MADPRPRRSRASTSPRAEKPPTASHDSGLYAELHLHLGGAILPNILYAHMQRDGHRLLARYPTFDRFERFFTKRRSSLADYLKMHTLVESLQRPADPHLHYYVFRLVRGAYLFDNLAYMELRHTPFNRTDPNLPTSARIDQMRSIVQIIGTAANAAQQLYPLGFTQILCLHSGLDDDINAATVALALEPAMRKHVSAIDIAGPNAAYRQRMPSLVKQFKRAKAAGLKTTAHLYETPEGCDHRLLPYLDRIGHGIQIPLRHPALLRRVADAGQCLEVCPTTYLRTGTLRDYTDLRPVFARCRDAGVDVAVCTDNAGLHNVRLPAEYENLLVRDVISIEHLWACVRASYRHAFAWHGPIPAALARIGARE